MRVELPNPTQRPPLKAALIYDGALSGTRTHGLSLRRAALYPLSYQRVMVPKVGFEPTRANAHYALNVARLPFRHFGADS